MMEFHKKLFNDRVSEVVSLYYSQIKEQEKFYEKEMKSATKIQSKFKMYQNRTRYLINKKSSVLIQKFIRGMIARFLVKRNAKSLNNVKIQRYFSNQAILIQKCFRGYYRRKYFHEFKARKKYLIQLQQKNEEFHIELLDYEQKQIDQKLQMEEQVAREEFIKIAANLHHLSSTKICPGVYNKQYTSQEMVFDENVETHLQRVFSQNYESIKIKQTMRYKQTQEDNQSESIKKPSLIKFGGGSMTSLRKSNHFTTSGKIRLNPL